MPIYPWQSSPGSPGEIVLTFTSLSTFLDDWSFNKPRETSAFPKGFVLNSVQQMLCYVIGPNLFDFGTQCYARLRNGVRMMHNNQQ